MHFFANNFFPIFFPKLSLFLFLSQKRACFSTRGIFEIERSRYELSFAHKLQISRSNREIDKKYIYAGS